MKCEDRLALLEAEIQRLETENQTLKDIISQVKRTVEGTYRQAAGEMSGNVPKGRYEYIKAQSDMCTTIGPIVGARLEAGVWISFPTLF